MTARPRGLFGTLRAAAAHAAGWLEAGNGRCLVCSAPLRNIAATFPLQARRLRGKLCDDCSASIPWIDRPVCPRCGRPVFCPDCERHPIRAFELNRSAVRYDATMREWLALYKYRGSERLEQALGEMLLPAFERLTGELAAAMPQPGGGVRSRRTVAGLFGRLRPSARAVPPGHWDAVTCVPVSRQRLEERGFNQAERLARAVAEHAGAPFVPLLVRTVHGEKQSMKKRADRLRTMRRVFAPDEAGAAQLLRQARLRPRPLRILLVDDIYTTGATSDACASAIRAALGDSVRVYVLTWARS